MDVSQRWILVTVCVHETWSSLQASSDGSDGHRSSYLQITCTVTAYSCNPSQDEQLDRANAILEGTSVFGKNAVSEMEKDSKIADMLFEVKELYFRLISLKSPNKLERSTWVRFLDFWRGRPTDGDVDVDIEHPVFTRLKDASVRLRSEADQRLAVLNPTLDVFQGVSVKQCRDI